MTAWQFLHTLEKKMKLKRLRKKSKGPIHLPKLVQHPSPNKSDRSAKISLVVLHDTEGPYAGSVSWLCNPQAQVSAHVVLSENGKEVSQLVPWSEKAWACAAFNSQSLNLEMAGYASKGYSETQIDAAAAIVAYWCKKYDIPVRYSSGNRPGITFHQDLGLAGGGHHDPGWNVHQRLSFVRKVGQATKRGVLPNTWGVA
jgi:N-acetyl-anhydromuramyl-L-alanine amidase AmpD